MLHNTPFIQDFMARYNYPSEAVSLFTEVLEKLDSNKSYARTFDALYDKFEYHRTRLDGKLLAKLDILAARMSYSKYTLHFVFVLSLTYELKEQYGLLGIDDKIYWDTMDDLRCKLLECIECKGVPGTFVADWFDGFFRLDRVAYGRFQYQLAHFSERNKPFTMSCGHVINPGDLLIGFHIPSSGVPLTDEVRYASYKCAWEHLHNLFPDGRVIFICGSWLLNPNHRKFLPENLNILKFMDDFEVVDSWESERFGDAWRVFGKYADKPVDEWPTDTALRKAYVDWIKSGGAPGGSAECVIMFDGEKIVR